MGETKEWVQTNRPSCPLCCRDSCLLLRKRLAPGSGSSALAWGRMEATVDGSYEAYAAATVERKANSWGSGSVAEAAHAAEERRG